MWVEYLLFTILTVTVKSSHIPKNGSDIANDVIVTYSGHAEAIEPPKPIPTPNPTNTQTGTTQKIKILVPESFATETTIFYEDDTESVLFVPNDKPVFRNGDYHDNKVNIGDILGRKTIADVFNDKKMRLETESPPEDILFISGKNNENVEKPSNQDTRRTANQPGYEIRKSEKKKLKMISLDCSNLDCNNTLKSVCGAKIENRQWKYRVFLNECYFRKVNCDFKYETNKYRVMPNEMCKPVGAHYSERPFSYNPPQPVLPREAPAAPPQVRRSFSSRRSLNIDVDGSFCSHACPAACPEDYSPECAVTSTGQRKVFVNHCKLDFNSCSYGTVWHRRPLSECVGNQKADIRQNRAFIGWMQKIGIVDGKGRLMME